MLFLSFSMVLHAAALQKNMGVTPADIESMRLQSKFYSVLDLKRTDSSAEMCSMRKGAVEKAQKIHYETVYFKQLAIAGKRKEAIAYLEKWNGVADVNLTSSSDTATKEFFIEQKRKRVVERQEAEKKKRDEARLKKASSGNMGDPPSKEEEEFFDAFDNLETAEGMSHYTILGVSPNAKEKEIMSAFRQKSRSCHPNSCQVQNSVSSLTFVLYLALYGNIEYASHSVFQLIFPGS